MVNSSKVFPIIDRESGVLYSQSNSSSFSNLLGSMAMNEPERWVLLSRVSTIDQERGTSLDKQRSYNHAYAEVSGAAVVEELHDVQTGRTLSRAGLQQAIALLENGQAE